MPTKHEDNKAIFHITVWGLAVNVLLTILKAVIGLAAGSLALLADAMHSLSDIATDGMVFLGVKLGGRPADANHPFGHGKIETMFALAISTLLIAGGVGIVWRVILALTRPVTAPPGLPVLIAAVLSVLLKEILYHLTVRVARKTGSIILRANAWHHRTDAFSSIVVLAGAGAILLGWPYGDQAAGMAVGIMVTYSGGKIGFDSLRELGEAGVDDETHGRLKEILENQPDIAAWHRLRARRVGREIYMDVHVLVDPALTVVAGHRIAQTVEDAIWKGLNKSVNVIVHIEPNLPEEKKEKDIS